MRKFTSTLAVYLTAAALGIALGACGSEGPAGQDGLAGTPGTNGTNGTPGDPGEAGVPGTPGEVGPAGETGLPGCDGLKAGETVGLIPTLTVKAPTTGTFFNTGDKVSLTFSFANKCGKPIKLADLGTANLYLVGPLGGALVTKTASKLLNCVTDRTVTDRQHHNINLIAPKYGDTTGGNLVANADGTYTYTTAAISDEPAGTYQFGIWAKSKDEKDQIFPLQTFQLKTATVDVLTTGAGDKSACNDCHKGTRSGGKSYMAHSVPGFSPLGNWALDSAAISDCKSCHNNDGYSKNPIIRKAHGVHRGEHMMAPGVAHPDYGLEADTTLAAFTDVGFPSMPGQEKNCTACHMDDNWKTKPSRLACGTCHDNVFWDTGTVTPPRVFGKYQATVGGPLAACTTDSNCAYFGSYATCNTSTGNCERKSHLKFADDTTCNTCHTADYIAGKHEVYERTKTRKFAITDVVLSGGSGGTGGAFFKVGDTITIKFKLSDSAGVVSDLKTNAALNPNLIIAGPTDAPQQLFRSINPKTAGTLTFDSSTGLYTYVLGAPIPANLLSPLNKTGTGIATPSGTYTAWLYLYQGPICADGAAPTGTPLACKVGVPSFRDAGGTVVNFKLGADTPIRPRAVITNAACGSCHIEVQLHGTTRRGGEACHTCHTQGATDRVVGAKGIACTTDAGCPGNAAGWENCQDTNGDGTKDTCVIFTDPTPDATIDFVQMIHNIHTAKLRAGYGERNDMVNPGGLGIVGFSNSYNDFSEVLMPQDARNCTKCHADTAATCSATAPCGVGQACVGGKCANVAWLEPSGRACATCHDRAATFAHVALNTWTDPGGAKVEACVTCHGKTSEFAVAKVHDPSGYNPPPSEEHFLSSKGPMPWFPSIKARVSWLRSLKLAPVESTSIDSVIDPATREKWGM